MKNYPFTAGARLKVLPLAISLLSLPTLVSNASAQALEEVLVTAERRVESLQHT